MRLTVLTGIATLALCLSTRAQSYTNFVNAPIPDGDLNGFVNSRTLSGFDTGSTLTNLTVALNVSGEHNGDLYVYLVHDTGFAVLLNRAGRTDAAPFGYSDPGLNFTFDDNAPNGNAHFYSPNNGTIAATGLWQPDARNVDPEIVTGLDLRTAYLSSFYDTSPNGTWTLFLADLSVGGENTLESWSFRFDVVPEPGPVALGLVGLLTGVLVLGRRNFRSSR
jgi:subtilisin-like proprotein convertase family protein